MSWAWMIWMSELPGPKPTFWWATSARAHLCLLPKEFEISGITGIRLDWVGIALVIEVWQLRLVSQTDVYKSTWGWRRNLDFACCQVEVCAYREGFERLKFMLCNPQILYQVFIFPGRWNFLCTHLRILIMDIMLRNTGSAEIRCVVEIHFRGETWRLTLCMAPASSSSRGHEIPGLRRCWEAQAILQILYLMSKWSKVEHEISLNNN